MIPSIIILFAVMANTLLCAVILYRLDQNKRDNRLMFGSFNDELEKTNKKLDTVGRVLDVYEKETQILRKHKEQTAKIASRFQTREPR